MASYSWPEEQVGGSVGTVSNVTFGLSLTSTPNPIVGAGVATLLNDTASPGNNYYYGTNGAGTKGWFAITGGAAGNPAAPDTSIQFNNGGVFGGSANLTWDNTFQTVTLSGIIRWFEVGGSLFMGQGAGNYTMNVGTFNQCFGFSSGASLTSGASNSCYGYSSGAAIAASSESSYYGYQSGMGASGGFNTYVGSQCGKGTSNASGNVGVGYAVFQNIINAASRNTALGSQSSQALTTGVDNLTGGYNCGIALTTARRNVFLGSLCANTGADPGHTVAIGFECAQKITGDGHGSVYIGMGCAAKETNGGANVYIGMQAGEKTVGGAHNVYIGLGAAVNATSGRESVCIGSRVATTMTTGEKNILIGYESDVSPTTLSNVIVLAHAGTATATGQCVIGSDSGPISNFHFGNGVTNPIPTTVTIWGTGGAGLNKTGSNVVISGGPSTGNVVGGSVFVQVTPPGASGSSPNFPFNVVEFDANLNAKFNGRVQPIQGSNVAAANNLTLGLDGNTFFITGNTQINAITVSNWQAGSRITLIFTGTPTIKHNTAGGAGTAKIKLDQESDLPAANGCVLSLIYDNTDWRQDGVATFTGA